MGRGRRKEGGGRVLRRPPCARDPWLPRGPAQALGFGNSKSKGTFEDGYPLSQGTHSSVTVTICGTVAVTATPLFLSLYTRRGVGSCPLSIFHRWGRQGGGVEVRATLSVGLPASVSLFILSISVCRHLSLLPCLWCVPHLSLSQSLLPCPQAGILWALPGSHKAPSRGCLGPPHWAEPGAQVCS